MASSDSGNGTSGLGPIMGSVQGVIDALSAGGGQAATTGRFGFKMSPQYQKWVSDYMASGPPALGGIYSPQYSMMAPGIGPNAPRTPTVAPQSTWKPATTSTPGELYKSYMDNMLAAQAQKDAAQMEAQQAAAEEARGGYYTDPLGRKVYFSDVIG